MLYPIIALIIGLLLGAGGYYLVARISGASILHKAAEEAEIIKKNKIVEAKEKFIALKLEHDNQVREQDKRIQQHEQRLQQREQQLNQKQGDVQRSLNEVNQKNQQIEQRQQALDYKQQEVERMHQEAEKQLEQILSPSHAVRVTAPSSEGAKAVPRQQNDTLNFPVRIRNSLLQKMSFPPILILGLLYPTRKESAMAENSLTPTPNDPFLDVSPEAEARRAERYFKRMTEADARGITQLERDNAEAAADSAKAAVLQVCRRPWS